ncbi:unnamed protein product, partial [Musa acuminata var. zebrina]
IYIYKQHLNHQPKGFNSLKGVVRFEASPGALELWLLLVLLLLFRLLHARPTSFLTLLFPFLRLALLKRRVCQNAAEKLSPPEGVGQRKVPLRCVVLELPQELAGEGPVPVLLHLRVQPLHPPHPDEEAREVAARLLPQPPLHAIPEAATAVPAPQLVDLLEVRSRYELHLREEHVPPLLRGLPGERDEEAARLLVGLSEVARRQVAGEDVEWRGRGSCACGGWYHATGRGGGQGGRGGGEVEEQLEGFGWLEEDRVGRGGEVMVVEGSMEGLEGGSGHWRGGGQGGEECRQV